MYFSAEKPKMPIVLSAFLASLDHVSTIPERKKQQNSHGAEWG